MSAVSAFPRLFLAKSARSLSRPKRRPSIMGTACSYGCQVATIERPLQIGTFFCRNRSSSAGGGGVVSEPTCLVGARYDRIVFYLDLIRASGRLTPFTLQQVMHPTFTLPAAATKVPSPPTTHP
jgi:hypothetical protein